MDSPQEGARLPKQLLFLQQQIHGEPDGVRADCLRAEHASLLARHGFQSDAEQAMAELRERYRSHPHPKVTAWINLADAIVGGRAIDSSGVIMKLRRAHALAQASANAPMQALAAAWLAFAFWNAHEVELAVGHAREALRRAAADDHKARARVCLVIAEIFALSAGKERAAAWFAAARRHAAAAADDASKSALSFNMSVIHGMLLRQAILSARGQADPRLAELHRAVSENVDAALGVPDDERTLMERARLLSLLDRPREALDLYRDHGPGSGDFRYREWPVWLADEAWCRCRLGEIERAVELAAAAEKLLDGCTQIDDRACVHSLLAKVHGAAGDAPRAALCAAAADQAWDRYAERQAAWASLCDAITEDG
jgi:hypothetical protein